MPPPTLLFSSPAPYRAHIPFLRKHLRAALPHLPPASRFLTEVAIALVGDAEMSRLHALSHNDPTPTDVLTYELDHTPKGDVTEGQIVICVPEARRRLSSHTMQASGRQALGREVLLYALHGLLHLTGHDDRTRADFDAMHAMEDTILEKIGIGALFYPGQPLKKPQARNTKPAPSIRKKTPNRSPRNSQPATRNSPRRRPR